MKKLVIILLAAVALPLSAFAQDKFGHINSQELLALMPERLIIESELDTLAKQYESEMLKMREEYYTKIKEFQEKSATMPESIKEARQSELMEMEQRIQMFTQTAQSDLQKKQEMLFSPIIEKVKKAITEVGSENGFTYIFDTATQSIVFQSPTANDVLPLVKKKLGI